MMKEPSVAVRRRPSVDGGTSVAVRRRPSVDGGTSAAVPEITMVAASECCPTMPTSTPARAVVEESPVTPKSSDSDLAEELRDSIDAKLLDESPPAAYCSIFRVPELIRRHNVDAYAPNVVSIGPFHKGGRPQFQLMQNVKGWYLRCLLKRCPHITLDRLIEGVMRLADRARHSYEEDLHLLSRKEFVEIMILDGCFLLELFTRATFDDLRDKNDPIFNQNYVREFLCHDLVLLENQIPWFVLECLHDLTSSYISHRSYQQGPTLLELVLNFLKQSLGDAWMVVSARVSSSEILHILDLIRTIMVSCDEISDIYDYIKVVASVYREHPRIPNATTLEESGIKFEISSSNDLTNEKFERGVFRIPSMNIDEMTEALLRNMIALEQCHHSRPHMITSYAVLMDNLIHSTKDIDLLCKRGIITVKRFSQEDAFKMFNNLCKDTATAQAESYHKLLFEQVNEHFKTPYWIVLKDTLRKCMKNLKLA